MIDLERGRAVRELTEIQQHLAAFEQKYELTSEEFYLRYEDGQLGDSADFMEWSSFYDMRRSLQQYLGWLAGEA